MTGFATTPNKKKSTAPYWSSYKTRGSPKWKSPSPGDAFKAHYDYHDKRPSLRSLSAQIWRAQRAAAVQTGASQKDFEPKVKPQLAALYTENYPTPIAAQAAVGHSAFLEYKARTNEGQLGADVESYLESPPSEDLADRDPTLFKKMVQWTAQVLHTRLLLEEMRRQEDLAQVETYRLFCAAQQSSRMATLEEVVRAAVLYADVLPPGPNLGLHPFTEALFDKLCDISSPYLEQLKELSPGEAKQTAIGWLRALCVAQSRFLPLVGQPTLAKIPHYDEALSPEEYRYARSEAASSPSTIPPLNAAVPPALEPASPLEQAVAQAGPRAESPGSTGERAPGEKALGDELKGLAQTLKQAGSSDSKWADLRPDEVQEGLAASPFECGSIEGDPKQGHEISLETGAGILSGEIFEQCLSPKEDGTGAAEQLLQDAAPLIAPLRKMTYLNVERAAEIERFHSTGSLDAARLHLSEISESIYTRHRTHDRVDRRGSPVLAILSDSSGSVGKNEMQMVKRLTAAWMEATRGSRVQVIAGLYNNSSIRKGLTGALIRWLWHPVKTLSTRRADAISALSSAPDKGEGAQSDALAIQHILDEAEGLAHGGNVYLIVIGDGGWCRSFSGSLSPADEIREVLEARREIMKRRLHTTLVLIGKRAEDNAMRAMDQVLRIDTEALNDPTAVAGAISESLAPVMKERSRLAARA